jgi:acyl-CoA thioesterase
MTDADDSVRERIADDPFCETLGIELASLEPGRAETALTVEARHLNFHGTPHGGAVYALADTAFAAASNSRGETAVALETNVSYLAAAAVGDPRTAVAEGTHTGRKTAEYSVEFTGGGEGFATFRGRVYEP